MRTPDLTRHAPPGIDLKYLKNTFFWGMSLGVLTSLFFLVRLGDTWQLFFRSDGIPEYDGTMMPEFLFIMKEGMLIFKILIPCMLAFTIYHYLYHRSGSRSDYLMRRLPDRWEYHRRCLTLPLAGAGAVLVTEVLLLLLYFLIYVLVTPEDYLIPGQLATIWRALL